MTMYFLIHESEDGEASIRMLYEAELQEQLTKGYYGDVPEWVTEESLRGHKGDNMLPGRGSYLIVKGAVVVPRPKVVKEYEL